MEGSCQVCLCHFNSEDHRPLLLPACGHTFCASCVQLLGQQGKTSCPKCRKDKAVLPVSSLPVNYSLLEIVQSELYAAAAAAEEHPSSPTEETIDGRRPPPPRLPDSPPEHSGPPKRPTYTGLSSRRSIRKRIKQDAPQPLPFSGRRNPIFTAQARLPTMTAPSPSVSGFTAFPTPARVMQAHNPSSSERGPEGELLSELDFQMAVHLTFCKDWNHDLDQHTSCPVWRQQMEEDDDLSTVLSLMQQI